MPLCFVSIGSNIEREHHIRGALQALHDRFGPLLLSSIRETAAVGFSGDPFHNLVAGFFTEEPPRQVLMSLADIEQAHGRVRNNERFGGRTLDLDLLLHGDLRDTSLKIPRVEIGDYAFVLEPLAEIAPTLRHPESGRTFLQLWEEFKNRR